MSDQREIHVYEHPDRPNLVECVVQLSDRSLDQIRQIVRDEIYRALEGTK